MLERALHLQHPKAALDPALADHDRPVPHASLAALAGDLLRRMPALLSRLGEFIASGGPLS